MRKLLLIVLVLGLMGFALAACGRDEPAPAPDPGPVELTPPATPAPPVEAPGVAEDVLVGTPTAGRLLAHPDGRLFTRAEILQITDMTPPAGELIMGSTTTLTPNFISGFESIATSQWMRYLMHDGRATMARDFVGNWVANPMVQSAPVRTTDHPDGSRTYTFTIYTDNLWSDGTPITAADYVFGILAYSSPQFRAIGGAVLTGEWLVGYQEFLNGPITGTSTDADGNEVIERGEPVRNFQGVRMYGPDSFSVTVRPEALPFVWEFLYMLWSPTPLHYWSNNGTAFTITDTPNGVTISDGFTEEFLQDRVNSPGGIRFNPTVVAGPYLLYSFDEGSRNAVFVRNPNFTATWDGFHPQIERIAKVALDSAIQIDALRLGEVDVLHGLRAGVHINDGLRAVEELGLHNFISYARSGFGFLAFHADFGPSQFVEVRRAVAWLLDRDDFARAFTGGHGFVLQGPYAVDGWEFQTVGDSLYADPRFTHFDFNPAMAVQDLEAGGWVLNSAGGPFVMGVDDIRYKDVDGELMRLSMQWGANDNAVSDIMRVMLIPQAEAVGMEIIEYLYASPAWNGDSWGRAPGTPYAPGGERFQFHHIHTLAWNVFPPSQHWYSWSLYPEHLASAAHSNMHHGDWQLHDLAWASRHIDASAPGWEEIYLNAWLEFQVRVNQVMTMLTLYADEDHDFFPTWLGNWDANTIWDFGRAVQRAYDGRTR
ncbi:MAG: ABC transporter substrate-binding protein [Defluviitaleaceae bacterium]|nr:ABC transporter substrate-binding protein [Defluviitaleaceae bacterium]